MASSSYADAAPHLALVARLEILLDPQTDKAEENEVEDILSRLADALREGESNDRAILTTQIR